MHFLLAPYAVVGSAIDRKTIHVTVKFASCTRIKSSPLLWLMYCAMIRQLFLNRIFNTGNIPVERCYGLWDDIVNQELPYTHFIVQILHAVKEEK